MRYKICLLMQNFIKFLEKYFCFTKDEFNEIKQKVNETKSRAEHNKHIEKKLPELETAVDKIKDENRDLYLSKDEILQDLKIVFLADMKGDIDTKLNIYVKYGLVNKRELLLHQQINIICDIIIS